MKTKTETAASTAWSWLSPEDAVRHALAAYYAASREAEQIAADPANNWATEDQRATWWLDEMHRRFGLRIDVQAQKAGLSGLSTNLFGPALNTLEARAEYVDNLPA